MWLGTVRETFQIWSWKVLIFKIDWEPCIIAFVLYLILCMESAVFKVQCFDAVGLVAGRASGL